MYTIQLHVPVQRYYLLEGGYKYSYWRTEIWPSAEKFVLHGAWTYACFEYR